MSRLGLRRRPKSERSGQALNFRIVLREFPASARGERWHASIEMPAERNDEVPYSLEFIATPWSQGPPVGRSRARVLRQALAMIERQRDYEPTESEIVIVAGRPYRPPAAAA